MLPLRRLALPFSLLFFSTAALAHPFLDVQPFPNPPPSVQSGTIYALTLVIFPGDTAVQSLQLDFEASPSGFAPPTGTLGEGFSLIQDDPLHFSVVGDFTDEPLEEFGEFPVAQLNLLALAPGGTLSILDSSVVV